MSLQQQCSADSSFFLQVPALPSQFSPDLTAIVHKMLARDARQRPSVHQLLRMEYVRKHIKMFLDRANNRKR